MKVSGLCAALALLAVFTISPARAQDQPDDREKIRAEKEQKRAATATPPAHPGLKNPALGMKAGEEDGVKHDAPPPD